VRLTRDNALEDVTILCPEHERAVHTDTSVHDWGTRAGRAVVDGLYRAARSGSSTSGIVTEGEDVATLQVQGVVYDVAIGGEVVTRGRRSQPISVEGGSIELGGIDDLAPYRHDQR
jgi:hypothetical protein